MLIVLEGPMPERTYSRGMARVTFKKGEPAEVDEDFGRELLSENPNKLTVEEAAPHCVPVFRQVAKGKSSTRAAAPDGEEVKG